MTKQITWDVKKRDGSSENWRQVIILALVGGFAFWAANFAISRTPIAAEYRTALGIYYDPMLFESLMGGLAIGFWVSFLLHRFYDRIPAGNPVIKSVIVSITVLVIVTILIGRPSSFSVTGNVSRYFLIGTIFNLIRFLALGIMIGYGCKRQRITMGIE